MKKKVLLVVLGVMVISSFVFGAGQIEKTLKDFPQLNYGASSDIKSSYYAAHVKMAALGDEALPDSNVIVTAPGGNEAASQEVLLGESHICGSGPATVYAMINGLGKWQDNPIPNRCNHAFPHPYFHNRSTS